VFRILLEIKEISKKGLKNNIVIAKCWNIIRAFSGEDSYIPRYLQTIEKELLGLFSLMKNPEKIEFDDEILQVLTNFMKKGK